MTKPQWDVLRALDSGNLIVRVPHLIGGLCLFFPHQLTDDDTLMCLDHTSPLSAWREYSSNARSAL